MEASKLASRYNSNKKVENHQDKPEEDHILDHSNSLQTLICNEGNSEGTCFDQVLDDPSTILKTESPDTSSPGEEELQPNQDSEGLSDFIPDEELFRDVTIKSEESVSNPDLDPHTPAPEHQENIGSTAVNAMSFSNNNAAYPNMGDDPYASVPINTPDLPALQAHIARATPQPASAAPYQYPASRRHGVVYPPADRSDWRGRIAYCQATDPVDLDVHWLKEIPITHAMPLQEQIARRQGNLELERLRKNRVRVKNNLAAKRSRANKDQKIKDLTDQVNALKPELERMTRERDHLLEICQGWGTNMEELQTVLQVRHEQYDQFAAQGGQLPAGQLPGLAQGPGHQGQ